MGVVTCLLRSAFDSNLVMKGKPNQAHSVDAPIAFLFHVIHRWRRATDARRSCMCERSEPN